MSSLIRSFKTQGRNNTWYNLFGVNETPAAILDAAILDGRWHLTIVACCSVSVLVLVMPGMPGMPGTMVGA